MAVQSAENPLNEQKIQKKISDMEPIHRSAGEIVIRRDQLKELVEPPLLCACQELYDKNIRTLGTSANKKDVPLGYAFITVEVSSMSPENQAIAKEFGEFIDYADGKEVTIQIPMGAETTTEEIEEISLSIAHRFNKQPMTWAPTYKIADLKKIYGIPDEEDSGNDANTWVKEGYYYDEAAKIFYLSQEHFRKVKEFQPDLMG